MLNKNIHVLLVDDEESMLEWLSILLEQNNFQVKSFSRPQSALEWAENNPIHVLVSDIKMPSMDGLELFSKIKDINPDVIGIFMTAFSSIDTAVKAVRMGASDYLLKPFKTDQMLASIEKAIKEKQISTENKALKQKLNKEYNFQGIIGKSEAIMELLNFIRKVADQPSTVLISGESGTGKELISKAIHNNSIRKDDPFVGINCGSLSPNLLESELFGHKKGSFTGAYRDKEGLMLTAGRGTLFLDEIGELNKDLQVKLLRAIQEKQVRAVGDTSTRPFKGRLICATNKNLQEMVNLGTFRRDLYYRLNVLPVVIPPLRYRKDDIPLLTEFFLRNGNYPNKDLSKEVMTLFTSYDWPGNVRELQNILERVCVMSSSTLITPEDLPTSLFNKTGCSPSEQNQISNFQQEEEFTSQEFKPKAGNIENNELTSSKTSLPLLSDIEKAWTYYVFEKKANGEKRAAAKLLGINEATLHRRLEKYKKQDS